jgi:hypothetical protein
MDAADPEVFKSVASECVALVASQLGRDLDWSPDSLTELDAVCASLTAGGPLTGPRLDLWCTLIGSYTGEVVVRCHGAQWISDPGGSGAPAISVHGVTGFPFATARRILTGEPFKSLASFARALPAIIEQSRKAK